jgi:hypothetical protein
MTWGLALQWEQSCIFSLHRGSEYCEGEGGVERSRMRGASERLRLRLWENMHNICRGNSSLRVTGKERGCMTEKTNQEAGGITKAGKPRMTKAKCNTDATAGRPSFVSSTQATHQKRPERDQKEGSPGDPPSMFAYARPKTGTQEKPGPAFHPSKTRQFQGQAEFQNALPPSLCTSTAIASLLMQGTMVIPRVHLQLMLS